MRVTPRSSGHGNVAASSDKSQQSGSPFQQCGPSPQPAFRSRRRRREIQLQPSSCPCPWLFRPPPSLLALLRSRSLHGFPRVYITPYISLGRCCATYATQLIWNISGLSAPSPGSPQTLLIGLQFADPEPATCTQRSLCTTGLGTGDTFISGSSEGPSATFMQADIGTTHREGGLQPCFAPRYHSQETRPGPLHNLWTGDRQPPACTIACF